MPTPPTPPPQRVQLPPYSMFPATPIYQSTVEGEQVIVFGLLQDPVVEDPSDIVYNVPVGGLHRLDLISQTFYGVPDLWWVIARVNNVLDPLVGPDMNTKIRIPVKARLGQSGLLSV
jgi:hypothetical protein